MSAENKAIVRRVVEEVWHQGNLSAVPELFAPNYVGQAPPEIISGPEGFQEVVIKYRTAFPDIRFTIEDLVAEEDKVVFHFSIRGTQTGDLPGVPATGKAMLITATGIVRIAGGKIVEERTNWDALGMLQQLGAIPLLGEAKGQAAS